MQSGWEGAAERSESSNLMLAGGKHTLLSAIDKMAEREFSLPAMKCGDVAIENGSFDFAPTALRSG